MAGERHEVSELVTPFWVMGLALIFAISIAAWIANNASNFQDLALGDQTFSIFGSLNGDKIFCGSIDEAHECLDPARRRNLKRRVVWLGNSQLHAINQPKPGDKTAPVLLAESLRPNGNEVIGFSMANASLTELMVIANYLQSDRHIDVLILPMFLDDTREQHVREELRAAIEQPRLKAELQELASGRYAIATMAKSANADAPAESTNLSLQQKSENAITGILEKCCSLQTTRDAAHGQIDVQAYLFRNWALNITAQSVRPIIPVVYQQNMTALEDIFRTAQRRSTRVIAYIPRLRQDFKPPYDPQQYREFKAQTLALAKHYGVRWVDLDRLVPGHYWGTKAATRTGGGPELDFMHYQEPGHVLLARTMEPMIEAALK
jgi:hypothetical protein